MDSENIQASSITVGVVGLGLMGSSIVASLLLAGHRVIAVSPLAEEREISVSRIHNHLIACNQAGILNNTLNSYATRYTVTTDYALLNTCQLVLECVIEIVEIKKLVYSKIEINVSTDTIIASNTSALPISTLQQYLSKPERFLGIHWAEPSYLTRFMEITCGMATLPAHADWVFELAHQWGKEPTLLKRDLRGFVTNRLMYAVYREGLNLVENGSATLENLDKAFRYDAGSWMTMLGIFRRMDFIGLTDYPEIFKNVFPLLSNSAEVPELMQQMIARQARGTQNQNGFFNYDAKEAKNWEDAFAAFNKEIYKLALEYSSDRINSIA
jgi:3-hydroxybutyryl-CoA dehydrogenase